MPDERNNASLPFSPSCENNKDPILAVLRRHFLAPPSGLRQVLEIAGGTGQHAVYFAQHLPHLLWQSSDLPGAVESLSLRIAHANLANLPPPIALDASSSHWNVGLHDYLFTANSLHIMPFSAVQGLFRKIDSVLDEGGRLCVYGPFKYGGEFTTASNADFDLWLKRQNPYSGVRDFERVNELALEAGLTLLEDNAMPANNQLLVWERRKGSSLRASSI